MAWRSAYRWGEDRIAGISGDQQRLCFALALWNGKDPILKERLFGLSNSEGNHGEDVVVGASGGAARTTASGPLVTRHDDAQHILPSTDL